MKKRNDFFLISISNKLLKAAESSLNNRLREIAVITKLSQVRHFECRATVPV